MSDRSKGCNRSHPHENMDDACKLKTEIARLNNQMAFDAAHRCLRPACGPTCTDCNGAIDGPTLFQYAKRYSYLRNRSLNAIKFGGVFAGLTPDNVVLNGQDLDAAIDDALALLVNA